MVDNSLNICYNINATTENDAFKAHRKTLGGRVRGFSVLLLLFRRCSRLITIFSVAIQPFDYVIRNHIAQDCNSQRNQKLHLKHLLSVTGIRDGNIFSITSFSTLYNKKPLIYQRLFAIFTFLADKPH